MPGLSIPYPPNSRLPAYKTERHFLHHMLGRTTRGSDWICGCQWQLGCVQEGRVCLKRKGYEVRVKTDADRNIRHYYYIALFNKGIHSSSATVLSWFILEVNLESIPWKNWIWALDATLNGTPAHCTHIYTPIHNVNELIHLLVGFLKVRKIWVWNISHILHIFQWEALLPHSSSVPGSVMVMYRFRLKFIVSLSKNMPLGRWCG